MPRGSKPTTIRDRVRELEQEVATLAQAKMHAERELYAVLDSRAWKLTTPMRRARQLLGLSLRAAKRRTFELTLAEFQDVEALDNGRFESLSEDPQFLLKGPSAGRLPYGWVLFVADYISEGSFLSEPELYFDYGLGFEAGGACTLPRPNDGVLSAVVRIERGARMFRFDPGRSTGTFELRNVRMIEITTSEAAARSALALARARHWTIRDLPRLASKGVALLREQGPRAVLSKMRGESSGIADISYENWLRRNDALDDNDKALIARRIAKLRNVPKLSVLMPVYNAPPKWLARAIDSVREQLYPNWELCIADDASSSNETREVLKRYAALDDRIKVCFREKNGHISEASNSALDLCTGEYVVLLDHDDELSIHALYMCAETINAHPDAVVLYSDEDKIDETGRRYDPYFKSDWNPDLFRSQNMVSHLGVYARSAMTNAGGFRKGLEGSQDYDLALRITENLRPEQIVHIPHVLYHWRSIPGSTAIDVSEKSYAVVASRKALEAHLARLGVDATVGRAYENAPYSRVRYNLPKATPRVSILIATRDRVDLLSQCVESITARTAYDDYEIVIADNQSREHETLDYLRELTDRGVARIIRYDKPFNYSAINNAMARAATGDILVLLNNDIEVISHDWLEEMVSQASRADIGCVGAMLYYPDDRIQHAGVILGIHGVAAHVHRTLRRGQVGYVARAALLQNFSAVTAACLAVRREIFDEVGGLDEKIAVAFNDVDFCLRVRDAGYRNLWTPYAELYHHESATRGSDLNSDQVERFEREVSFMIDRWGDVLRNDPAYNPNLSLSDDGFFGVADITRASKPWREDEVAKADNVEKVRA